MGFHTFPLDRADALEDPFRYRFCSREEVLELLDPDPDAAVADLGSGTGFYTRDVAPFVDTLYAIDVQPEMHEYHREVGQNENVEFVTAAVDSLPFETSELDGAFSIMTHHEYATTSSLAELHRVIASGGELVTVDWSRTGTGEEGPPVAERFGPETAVEQFETAGFSVEAVRERPETFAILARA